MDARAADPVFALAKIQPPQWRGTLVERPALEQALGQSLRQHKLTLLRRKGVSTMSFRRLLREIAMLMAYEVLRDMPIAMITAAIITGR